MKKRRYLSAILASLMLLGALASCTDGGKDTETDSGSAAGSETQAVVTTEKPGTVETEIDTEEEEETIVAAEGEYGKTITLAKQLSGTVNANYWDNRMTVNFSNKNVAVNYPLSPSSPAGTGSITTTDGKVYVSAISQAFVTNKSGRRFLSTDAQARERLNIYRLGSYYYEVHLMDGLFANYEVVCEQELKLKSYRSGHDIEDISFDKSGVLSYTVASTNDPYLNGGSFNYSTETYNALEITIATTDTTSGTIYLAAGSHAGIDGKQTAGFSIVPDGEFHTYIVPFTAVVDYEGNITRIRLDIGSKAGEIIKISSLKLVGLAEAAPAVKLDRTYHLYSDKVNEVIRLVASKDVSDLASFGSITTIAADTVDKLIIKDKNGTHDSLDGVDFASAEYVAFDIKGAGVYGHILLPDETSGVMTVELVDGNYVITQEYTLPEGTVVKQLKDVKSGHRIYTDESHSFDAFLKAAEEERHPLTEITVAQNKYGAKFARYDVYRGAYVFDVKGFAGFQAAYDNPYQRYNVTATIKGVDADRAIYVINHTTSGNLESGALVSADGLMLPVDLEVCKNFGGEHEEPFYDDGDTTYGEIIFPYVIEAGKDNTFNVVNLYQNWGSFPLKQISSIQFHAPYYHLSVGTTESNCIAPYFVYGKDRWTLPDFRAMSAPFWSTQPQHTSIGRLYFLEYTTADGQFVASESMDNKITSYGPTYCDIDMNYLSDDTKIKAYYRHMEMPHTDENRTYYELVLEVQDTIEITDFKNDFAFFSFDGRNPFFKKMGYLNEKNECVITDSNTSAEPKFYVLGDKSPYMSYFDGPETTNVIDYVNFALIVKNYSFTVGGKAYDGNMILRDVFTENLNRMSLTLDLGSVTLQKGDKFVINMILMPWGDPTANNDDNVRNVRQDACLDPYKLDVATGSIIEDVYLPRVMSENGVAEFTLSGGTNYCVVRVYGYDKLTVPTVMEKVDGKWVEYQLHSDAYEFDGYTVYYEGDGTYSYAFVVDMTDVDARTFKVTADAEFKPLEEGWINGHLETIDIGTLPLNVYVTPANRALISASITMYGCTLSVSEDNSYFRFTGNGQAVEAYVTPISNLSAYESTGQYIVFKYRLPTTNSVSNNRFEIFTSTVNNGASAQDYTSGLNTVIQDGEWHVVVIDASVIGTYKPDENGVYHANYFRVDILNMSQNVPTDCYIDFAYFGMSDSIEDICKLNSDMDTVMLVQNGKVTHINTATGQPE